MNLAFYTNFASTISQQEAQLNKLEQQTATGLAVQTPDQNPAAYETATIGNDQINALASDTNTQATIQSQLGSVNDTFQSVSSLLDNVQSVIEQGLNGTTSAANLQSLATQVNAAASQLVSLGNTTGSNGSYLFGGSRGSIAPFQTTQGSTVAYMGDGGQSLAAITPDTVAATITNGDVFMSGLSGDGSATVAANAANTGSAVLLSNGIANPAAASAFQTGNSPITLSFASGAGGLTYTASQGGSTIATGSAAAGASLQLAGVDFQLSGGPAAGDSFTISPSRPQSAFALLQSVATAMASAGTTPAQVAQTRQQLNNGLSALAQYQQSIITSQAQNGVTLQAVNNAQTNNTNQETALQSAVQKAVGVNMPVAITQLNESITAIQAAMKAFSSAQSLSLFSYL